MVPAPRSATSSTSRTSCAACRSLDAADAGTAAEGQAARLLRPAARAPLEQPPRRRSGAARKGSGIEAVFKLRRHLRRRVRGVHAVLLLAPTKRRSASAIRSQDGPRVATGPMSTEDEIRPPTGKPRIMILGGGPNRIGQGIEFDYCCCQAAFALRDAGFETIMVNSNPETVTTDYDTSDHLFFEPLTVEDVLNICDRMQPEGRDRAVRRADAAEPGQAAGGGRRADHRHQRRVASTSPRTASGSASWSTELGLKQPANGTALDLQQAVHVARRIGFPVLVRPSFVLGGRAMEIVYDEDELSALHRPGDGRVAGQADPDRPVPRVGRSRSTSIASRDGTRTRDRRRDAAHRGGRHPLRRLGVRHPAAQPAAGGDRRDQAADRGRWPRPEREGADEHPVRGRRTAPTAPRRHAGGLHPRSQPAGQPHGAVRVEGDRRAAGPATRRWSWSARRSTSWA